MVAPILEFEIKLHLIESLILPEPILFGQNVIICEIESLEKKKKKSSTNVILL